jgi:hypothetical protein
MMQGRPDTEMFVRHRLVPVTSILPTPMVKWGPVLLKDLADRDLRRVGGYKKAARVLDQFDEDAETRWKRETAEGAEVRARASWKGQKWSNGETVDLGARKIPGARRSKRREYFTGVGDSRLRPTQAGDGALFGRDPLKEATPYFDEKPTESRIIVAVP